VGELTKSMEKIGLDMRIAALVSLPLLSFFLYILWLGFEHQISNMCVTEFFEL